MRRLPFRVEMARAWHEGRKTVTRRIVKPQPTTFDFGRGPEPAWVDLPQLKRRAIVSLGVRAFNAGNSLDLCPYNEGSTVIIAEPLANVGGIVKYAADGVALVDGGVPTPWGWKVNALSSRYMPNWAARSWARIVSVRCERLQDITGADALAEGICYQITDGANNRWFGPSHAFDVKLSRTGAIEAYRSLFESINGPGSWDANPWVFRYELEKQVRP